VLCLTTKYKQYVYLVILNTTECPVLKKTFPIHC